MARIRTCMGLAIALFSGPGSQTLFSQSLTSGSASAPRFLMADVHTGNRTPNSVMSGGFYRGGRYELHNATMIDLIRTAYGVDPDKVIGGPAWATKDAFEIVATAPADTKPESLKAMLKALLAERFSLVVHPDTQPVPAYAITAGSSPNLKQADGSGETGCKVVSNVPANAPGVNIVRANLNGNNVQLNLAEPIPFACSNMTMAAFADGLRTMIGAQAYILNTPVVDQTGLTGRWNFDVKWTLRQGPAATVNAAGTVTMAEAFDKQLGLKLELTKAPFPVIVVDSANETPTPNLPGVTEKLAPQSAGFEVVDLRPSLPFPNSGIGGGGGRGGLFMQGTGRIGMQGQSVKGLIATAWNLTGPDQVTGGPKSAETVLYDLTALVPTPELTPGFGSVGAGPMNIDSMRQMLQALLKERFQLSVHEDAGSVPAYQLVAVQPTLKKADSANRSGCVEGPAPGEKDPRSENPAAGRLVTCLNMSVSEFAAELRNRASGYLAQYPPPMDATGIQGKFDITLNFSAAGSTGPGTITLFDAIEKQLGLRLQMGKRHGKVLVIDHCEDSPIEN